MESYHPADWRAEALCREVDSELFYPPKSVSVRKAVEICADCPVRLDCLTEALANNERWGVWGGVSMEAYQRAKNRKAA